MISAITIIFTGMLVAAACALLGTFLVLRRMAMMADAISHAILPGLVAGYFLAQGPNILAGFLGAAAAGIVTVTLVELFQNTRRVGGDSAIGIVFPAMFALGTFLVSKFFANVHLDTDAILYGNIEFASLDTLDIGGVSLGAQSLWVMGFLVVLNGLFVALFYKELKLATFDPGLAAALGFSPVLIHYGLMSLLSVTTVGAFTAVGAVLVVALIVVPPATAYLLTEKLPLMMAIAVGCGMFSALGGYLLALAVDASVAGSIVLVAGVLFGLALLFSPLHGVVAKARRRAQQRSRFAVQMLVVHLYNHEGTAIQATESQVAHLGDELRWTGEFAQQAINGAVRSGLVTRSNGHLDLTESGRTLARQVSGEPGQVVALATA